MVEFVAAKAFVGSWFQVDPESSDARKFPSASWAYPELGHVCFESEHHNDESCQAAEEQIIVDAAFEVLRAEACSDQRALNDDEDQFLSFQVHIFSLHLTVRNLEYGLHGVDVNGDKCRIDYCCANY